MWFIKSANYSVLRIPMKLIIGKQHCHQAAKIIEFASSKWTWTRDEQCK